jgi:hypothetical protein
LQVRFARCPDAALALPIERAAGNFVPTFSLQFFTLAARFPLWQKPELGRSLILAEVAVGTAINAIPAITNRRQAARMFVGARRMTYPPNRPHCRCELCVMWLLEAGCCQKRRNRYTMANSVTEARFTGYFAALCDQAI